MTDDTRESGGGRDGTEGWQRTALSLTQFSVGNHVLADVFCEAYLHVMDRLQEDGLLSSLRVEPPYAREAMYADLRRRARETEEDRAGRLYVLLGLMMAGIGGQGVYRKTVLTDLLGSEGDRMSPSVLALVRNIRDGRTFSTDEVRVLIGWRSRSRATCAPDYTWIGLDGTTYSFSKPQERASVRVLWEAGGTWVHEDTVRDRIGANTDRLRLAHVFRSKKGMSPAWGTVVESRGENSRQYRIPR